MPRRVAPTQADINTPIHLNRRSLVTSVLFFGNLLLMPFKAYLSEDSPFQQSSAPTSLLQPKNTTFAAFEPVYLKLLQDRYAHIHATNTTEDYVYDDTYCIDVYRRVVSLEGLSPTALVLEFPTSALYTAYAVDSILAHGNGTLDQVQFASYVTFLDMTGFILAAWVRPGNTISGDTSDAGAYTIYVAFRNVDYPYVIICCKFVYRCLLSLGTAMYIYRHYYCAVRRLLVAYHQAPRAPGVSHVELLIGEPTDFVLTNAWITLGYTTDCVLSSQFIGRAMSRAYNTAIAPVPGMLGLLYLSRLVWFGYITLVGASRVLHGRHLTHLYVPVDSLVVAALATLNAASVIVLSTNSFGFRALFYVLMQSVVLPENARFTTFSPFWLGVLLAYWSRGRRVQQQPAISLRARLLLWVYGIRGVSRASKGWPAPYLATFLAAHPPARANCTLSQDDEDCYLIGYGKDGNVVWVRRLVWTKTLALHRATSLGTDASHDATSPIAHLTSDPDLGARIVLGAGGANEWIY
ncbi:hypothetical protein SDRG_02351 [Saprolegnia diclina VS20]|uniref:Uncharacterized protein n=1 Tax=Saprolegnia diclina (strain VS20) TaxID=1156394 RepID=T0SCF0_SAPDV|nr:hypothetical protein SDRG_02351 [Saprolegnia diclina VS20]EQC40457.1 hypothetical protein SDRG_02351 [Saprolegnia diclina VS20]|eukprot:XP_008606156.1 hypothetical protein SDRG_02351 [Saprolegnia diclina VS20]